MKNAIALGALIAVFSLSYSYGDEKKSAEVKAETQEMSRDAGRGLKRAGREIEDKTCELVNGKAECTAKKGLNALKNGADKVEDAVE